MTPSVTPLRRPEFTGENRCWRCTLLNLVIVLAVGLLLAVIEPLAAVVVGGVSVVVIYLRGYVIPGTPWFGPRVATLLPVQFDHEQPDHSDSLPTGTDPDHLIDRLVEADILHLDGDQLLLDPSFDDEWQARIEELRTASDSELLDRTASVLGEDVEGEMLDEYILLTGDECDTLVRQAVAIAETAAAEALDDHGVAERIRVPAAGPLTTFLRNCPLCGGDIGETTIQHCCGGHGSVYGTPERPALVCSDCDAVVHVFQE